MADFSPHPIPITTDPELEADLRFRDFQSFCVALDECVELPPELRAALLSRSMLEVDWATVNDLYQERRVWLSVNFERRECQTFWNVAFTSDASFIVRFHPAKDEASEAPPELASLGAGSVIAAVVEEPLPSPEFPKGDQYPDSWFQRNLFGASWLRPYGFLKELSYLFGREERDTIDLVIVDIMREVRSANSAEPFGAKATLTQWKLALRHAVLPLLWNNTKNLKAPLLICSLVTLANFLVEWSSAVLRVFRALF